MGSRNRSRKSLLQSGKRESASRDTSLCQGWFLISQCIILIDTGLRRHVIGYLYYVNRAFEVRGAGVNVDAV